MLINGIGKTAKREMKRPSRARILLALVAYQFTRADNWLNANMVKVFASIGASVIVVCVPLAMFAPLSNSVIERALALVALLVMSGIGILLIVIATCEHIENTERLTHNKKLAKVQRAYEMELGKMSKQLLDANLRLVVIGEEINEQDNSITQLQNDFRKYEIRKGMNKR